MKKNVLFVIDSLDCAGAEKSLVTLLSLLDYSKYNVDLLLFGYGGLLENLIPKKVKLLKPLRYTEYSKLSLKEAFIYSMKYHDFQMLTSRFKYSMKIRRKQYTNPQKARLFWQSVSNVIEENPKEYDIAISYAQGVPTFYVADKVKAKKKYSWVNTSYCLDTKEREYQRRFYEHYNKIIAVSDSAKEILSETFPYFSKKIDIIYDINNPRFIMDLANCGEGFDDNFKGLRILTIGRLAEGKGYDIALSACKKLKEKGVNFKWYVLGKGALKEEIEDYIKQNNLSEHFILLGVKANPYPYIKKSDIYVQTSRFEGFGLAIAEARMLNTPVVTTRFDAVYNQMIDGKNGIVVDMHGAAVCEGILQLVNNPKLKESIVHYLETEKKGNVEEIEKFYKMIG